MINELIEKITIATGKKVTAQKVVELINGGVRDATTELANTITPSTATVFNSSLTDSISAVMITSTKVLVTYRNVGNNCYGTAIILNIDGDTITPSSETVFNGANTLNTSAVMLTSTKVLVTYRNVGNNCYGTAIILNIDGDTITPAMSTVFNSSLTDSISAVMITSTKVLVVYQNGGNSNYGTAIILDISDNTITPSSETVFNGANTLNISAVTLTSTKVLVVYQNGGNSNYGTAIILNIDGDTITPASETVFSASTYNISAVTLTSTKVLVVYQNGGNNCYGTAIILNIDGDTITPAMSTVFNSSMTDSISAVMITSTKVLVAYRKDGNRGQGIAIILNISDNTITPATATVFNSSSTEYISAVMLTSTKVLVTYKDGGNRNYGTAIILNGNKIPPSNVLGISKTTSTSGKADISMGELIGGFSGLTQGAYQYVADNGSLTETPETVTTPVSIAINETTIKWLNQII